MPTATHYPEEEYYTDDGRQRTKLKSPTIPLTKLFSTTSASAAKQKQRSGSISLDAPPIHERYTSPPPPPGKTPLTIFQQRYASQSPTPPNPGAQGERKYDSPHVPTGYDPYTPPDGFPFPSVPEPEALRQAIAASAGGEGSGSGGSNSTERSGRGYEGEASGSGSGSGSAERDREREREREREDRERERERERPDRGQSKSVPPERSRASKSRTNSGSSGGEGGRDEGTRRRNSLSRAYAKLLGRGGAGAAEALADFIANPDIGSSTHHRSHSHPHTSSHHTHSHHRSHSHRSKSPELLLITEQLNHTVDRLSITTQRLQLTTDRLNQEIERANRAERDNAEVLAHLRNAVLDKKRVEKELEGKERELGMWRVQGEVAQAEIIRAQEVTNALQRQLAEVEERASRDRDRLRKMIEERVTTAAREEGYRQGLAEARRVAGWGAFGGAVATTESGVGGGRFGAGNSNGGNVGSGSGSGSSGDSRGGGGGGGGGGRGPREFLYRRPRERERGEGERVVDDRDNEEDGIVSPVSSSSSGRSRIGSLREYLRPRTRSRSRAGQEVPDVAPMDAPPLPVPPPVATPITVRVPSTQPQAQSRPRPAPTPDPPIQAPEPIIPQNTANLGSTRAGRSTTNLDDTNSEFHPIPVHNHPNRSPAPSHRSIIVPPEGYIPTMGPDATIRIPPPHEMGGRMAASEIGDAEDREREREVRERDFAYAEGAGRSRAGSMGGGRNGAMRPGGRPPGAPPIAVAPSAASTRISAYDLVSPPRDQRERERERYGATTPTPAQGSGGGIRPRAGSTAANTLANGRTMPEVIADEWRRSQTPAAGGSGGGGVYRSQTPAAPSAPAAGGSGYRSQTPAAGGSIYRSQTPAASGSGYRSQTPAAAPAAGGGIYRSQTPAGPAAGGSGYRSQTPAAGGSGYRSQTPAAGGYRSQTPGSTRRMQFVVRNAGVERGSDTEPERPDVTMPRSPRVSGGPRLPRQIVPPEPLGNVITVNSVHHIDVNPQAYDYPYPPRSPPGPSPEQQQRKSSSDSDSSRISSSSGSGSTRARSPIDWLRSRFQNSRTVTGTTVPNIDVEPPSQSPTTASARTTVHDPILLSPDHAMMNLPPAEPQPTHTSADASSLGIYARPPSRSAGPAAGSGNVDPPILGVISDETQLPPGFVPLSPIPSISNMNIQGGFEPIANTSSSPSLSSHGNSVGRIYADPSSNSNTSRPGTAMGMRGVPPIATGAMPGGLNPYGSIYSPLPLDLNMSAFSAA